MFLPACLLSLALAASPPPVAHVVAGTDNVSVVHEGVTKRAAPNLELYREDLLKVPPKGLLMVRVDKNEQVVRIDEDLELKVSDIAVLDAEKRASSTWREQVDQLLTPREKGQGGTARMIGWFVSPTGANVQASLNAKDVVKSDSRERPEATSQEAQAVPSSPKAPARTGGAPGGAPPIQDQPAPAATPKSVPSSNKDFESAPMTTPAPPAPPPPSVAPARSVGGRIGGAPSDGPPRACVDALVERFEPAVRTRLGDTLDIKVRRVGGAVFVFIEGALPVDECIRTWAEARPNLTEKWQQFEVRLK